MMKKVIVLFLVVACGLGVWMIASAGGTSPALPYVTTGKADLYAHTNAQFANAVTAFQNAVTADSTNQEAQFYYAVTQVAWVYQNPSATTTGALTSLEQILQLSGVSFITFGLYDTETSPGGSSGLPSTTPTTGAAFTFLRYALLPKIQTALTSLTTGQGQVTTGFTSTLQPSALDKTGSALTVDYGDALVIEAGLYAAEGVLDFLLAYNLNVNPIPLVNTQGLDSRTLFRLAMQQNSALLTPAYPTFLASAQTAISNSITTFNNAVTAIQNRSVASGHLFVLDVPVGDGIAETSAVTNLQALLANIQASLNGPTAFTGITKGKAAGKTFNMSPLFNTSGGLNIRTLVSDANDNFAQTDPTWGGIDPYGAFGAFKGTINTVYGWNLVSLPAIPADLVIADVLSPVSASCLGVWGYNAASQEYLGYSPGSPSNSLTSFTAGQGYWVYTTGAGALALKGGSAPATVKLNQGWNLVGYGGSSCIAPSTVFSSLGSALQVSWGYPARSWKVYDPNDTAGSTLALLCPNNAYWIKVNQATTWTVPTN
jgi:hypothetical protein